MTATDKTEIAVPQGAWDYAVLRLQRALTDSPERRDPELLLRQLLTDLNTEAHTERFTVRRAYGKNAKPDGWDIFDGEEWAQRFHYKATAVEYARKLNDETKGSTR